MPVGLNIGTTFELAELKVQWLLLDFGRRLGRYEQARLATDIAGLQTDRAFQTVANEVAIAYYSVLRSQALRRTAQDALRRAEEEVADARKRQREGVVEREIVLRTEVQRAENLQLLHAATEAEFVALAELNLAIGLKCNQPVKRRRAARIFHRCPPRWPNACRRPSGNDANSRVVRRSVDIAVQGGRVARADFVPKVIADGDLVRLPAVNSSDGRADLALGFIRLDWTLFEGGRRIAAARVADSQFAAGDGPGRVDGRQYRVPGQRSVPECGHGPLGIDDARPAVDQASENYRLVQIAGPRRCGHAHRDHRRAGLADPGPAELLERSV